MPSIEPRRNALGQITSYRIVVSAGLDYQGKQIKRRSIWTPPTYGMSETQMEREARAAAYKFEESLNVKIKNVLEYLKRRIANNLKQNVQLPYPLSTYIKNSIQGNLNH